MSHTRSLSKCLAAASVAVAAAVSPCLGRPAAFAFAAPQEKKVVDLKVEAKVEALDNAAVKVVIMRQDVMVKTSTTSTPTSTSPALSAPAPTNAPVLNLADGGFAAGELRDAKGLRWLSPQFAEPFDFAPAAVNSIHWPAKEQVKPTGDFCFELAGGDVLYGALVELGDAQVVIDVPKLGKLTVERSALRRIDRWSASADLIYSGPIGLTGWKDAADMAGSTAKKGWREEAGQPISDQPGSTIRGAVGLPPRAIIEFELSWKTTPDFVLALGVGDDDKADGQAFRFETWEGQLVAQRELGSLADVAAVQPIPAGPGRVNVQAYLDQEAGRMTVVSSSGKPLGDLKVSDPKAKDKAKSLPNIALTNNKGDLRLERLRVRRWNGEPPREAKADQSRIHLDDGSIVYGRVERLDSDAKEYVVKGESGETRVPAGKVASMFLSAPSDPPARSIRVASRDGSRLSGDLAKVEGGEVYVTVPGIKETPHLPVNSLLSLVVLRREPVAEAKEKPADAPTTTTVDFFRGNVVGIVKDNAVDVAKDKPADLPKDAFAAAPKAKQADAPKEKAADEPKDVPEGLLGTLELDGLRLKGRLIDGVARPGATCLTWKPEGSSTAGAIRAGASGRIVYREPKPVPVPMPGGQPIRMVRVRPAAPAGFVQGVFGGLADAQAAQPAGPAIGRRAIHLRTGDVIPSEVSKIDELGVTFKTPLSDATFVSHEKIKAVELAPEPPATVRLNKIKRERLLTLPRMQKDSPPTQMIRAKNGDFLRGRITEMDAKTLKVEIHLETKEIPRDRVSRIIWLHPEELEVAKPGAGNKAADPPKPAVARVQAIRSDGIRMTFTPESFADSTLLGKSDVLGNTRVKLDEVDALLLGSAIEKAAGSLTYGPWKLHNATEPLIAMDEDAEGNPASGRTPGTESAMIGKPAPDFTLDLLGEGTKPFHLADAKGKIVILDFWATWCGPCIQAMPQVESVAEAFKDKGVQLIAVNLEEDAKTIKSMLERHKMKMTVALDRDGATAAKYQANAIPQTVIIDKEGNVARLFVGGGPKFGEQLKAAVEAVLDGKDAPKVGEPKVIKD